MTPHPQQKYIIEEADVEIIEMAFPKSSFVRHLRSHPHTPAPAAPDNELEELGNQDIDPAIFEAYANACNKGAEEQYVKEYAAAIRNQTLSMLSHEIEQAPDDEHDEGYWRAIEEVQRIIDLHRTPSIQEPPK